MIYVWKVEEIANRAIGNLLLVKVQSVKFATDWPYQAYLEQDIELADYGKIGTAFMLLGAAVIIPQAHGDILDVFSHVSKVESCNEPSGTSRPV